MQPSVRVIVFGAVIVHMIDRLWSSFIQLFNIGGGEHGQLGHGDRVNKLKPTFVHALDGTFISQITCGWSHTVALTSTGKVNMFHP